MFCISIEAKVNSSIKAIKNTISCVFRRRNNLAHELFVILDFLSWWPCKVNPCIAVHPMNTKYGWIKHFHSSHYYLISCLTELSVWSNPWGFTTTRTGIIMTSGLLLGKYSKPEKSHRYFPSSFVWSISASTLSINKSLLMHLACSATCYGKHFKSETSVLIFWGENDDILGWFSFNMPVVSAAVLRVIPPAGFGCQFYMLSSCLPGSSSGCTNFFPHSGRMITKVNRRFSIPHGCECWNIYIYIYSLSLPLCFYLYVSAVMNWQPCPMSDGMLL